MVHMIFAPNTYPPDAQADILPPEKLTECCNVDGTLDFFKCGLAALFKVSMIGFTITAVVAIDRIARASLQNGSLFSSMALTFCCQCKHLAHLPCHMIFGGSDLATCMVVCLILVVVSKIILFDMTPTYYYYLEAIAEQYLDRGQLVAAKQVIERYERDSFPSRIEEASILRSQLVEMYALKKTRQALLIAFENIQSPISCRGGPQVSPEGNLYALRSEFETLEQGQTEIPVELQDKIRSMFPTMMLPELQTIVISYLAPVKLAPLCNALKDNRAWMRFQRVLHQQYAKAPHEAQWPVELADYINSPVIRSAYLVQGEIKQLEQMPEEDRPDLETWLKQPSGYSS